MFTQVFLQGYLSKEAAKTDHMVRPPPADRPVSGPPGLHSQLGLSAANWLKSVLGSSDTLNFGVHPGVMRLKGQQAIRNMPAADKAQIANQAGKAFNPQPAK